MQISEHNKLECFSFCCSTMGSPTNLFNKWRAWVPHSWAQNSLGAFACTKMANIPLDWQKSSGVKCTLPFTKEASRWYGKDACGRKDELSKLIIQSTTARNRYKRCVDSEVSFHAWVNVWAHKLWFSSKVTVPNYSSISWRKNPYFLNKVTIWIMKQKHTYLYL